MAPTTPFHNAATLDKAESLAVLENGIARGSATTSHDVTDDAPSVQPPLTLDLSLRRGRLALLAVVTLAVVVALTVVFARGVEVSRFDARDKNATQQTDLVDDYNSYSGNISSAFGKPIEAFVTIVAQLLVLRFMLAAMLQPQLNWRVGAVTLGLSVAMGYLISNGFNALNVQLRPLDVEPVISTTDLAYEAAGAETNNSSLATVSENAPANPLSNTILRTVVHTRVQKTVPQCSWAASLDTGIGLIPDTTLDFGFTQRDWQTRVLQHAVAPSQLRVIANATNSQANKTVAAADLPMNASLAADLFVYGVLTSTWLVASVTPGNSFSFDMNRTNPKATKTAPAKGPFAQVAGLVPPASQGASELDQSTWFLQKFPTILSRTIAEPRLKLPFKASDIAVDFSHVDIADGVAFDAVTFELEVDPTALSSNKTSVGPRVEFPQSKNCGPWPALCLLPKDPLFSNDLSIAFDVPTHVGALAMCADANGVEGIGAEYGDGPTGAFVCPQRANSSLLIVSVGKRVVADAIQQNASATGNVAATNVRKFFSFTIGRLSWTLADLATVYHAKCTDDASCDGLVLPLASNGSTTTPQQLVVGRASLPVASLPPLENLYNFRPRALPLVQLNELPRIPKVGNQVFNIAGGDPLLLHNVKTTTWDTKTSVAKPEWTSTFGASNGNCDSFVEDRLFLTIKNHLYMEHSLQPAYTAATFFLFQNGVVKDTINLSNDRLTLSFDKNVQEIAVWASIPTRNASFTLGGCIIVVIGLAYILLTARNGNEKVATVSEPHVIARVMLDEQQFPPVVFHRRVVGATDATEKEVDAFVIGGLSLQHQDQQIKSS